MQPIYLSIESNRMAYWTQVCISAQKAVAFCSLSISCYSAQSNHLASPLNNFADFSQLVQSSICHSGTFMSHKSCCSSASSVFSWSVDWVYSLFPSLNTATRVKMSKTQINNPMHLNFYSYSHHFNVCFTLAMFESEHELWFHIVFCCSEQQANLHTVLVLAKMYFMVDFSLSAQLLSWWSLVE